MDLTTLTRSLFDLKLCAARYAALAIVFSLLALTQFAVQGQQATSGPKAFASPELAAEALIAATESFDEAALKEILGYGNYDLIHSGEIAQDREVAAEFAKMGRAKMTLTPSPRNKRLVSLAVGEDNWPCPLPIVKRANGWIFDADAGRQELIYRRVGRNELDAIKICRGVVEAENEYALEKHDGAPVNQYAQRIISTPGKHDGLAWVNADGTPGGPVGENVAKAIAKGYSAGGAPYHGYYFKLLKGQGPAAPLGKMDYVVNGYMIGGFALLAYPSHYQVTGVKSFIVSQDGVVYEKDLGINTLEVANGIELFNPDKTWAPVLDDDDDD